MFLARRTEMTGVKTDERIHTYVAQKKQKSTRDAHAQRQPTACFVLTPSTKLSKSTPTEAKGGGGLGRKIATTESKYYNNIVKRAWKVKTGKAALTFFKGGRGLASSS